MCLLLYAIPNVYLFLYLHKIKYVEFQIQLIKRSFVILVLYVICVLNREKNHFQTNFINNGKPIYHFNGDTIRQIIMYLINWIKLNVSFLLQSLNVKIQFDICINGHLFWQQKTISTRDMLGLITSFMN